MAKKKWMQKAVNPKEKGELREKMKTPKGEKIPTSKLESQKKTLQEKGKGDKKMTAAEREKLQQIQFALNARKSKKKKKSNLLIELKAVGDYLDKQGKTEAANHIDQALKALAIEEVEFGPGRPPWWREMMEWANKDPGNKEDLLDAAMGSPPERIPESQFMDPKGQQKIIEEYREGREESETL